MKRRAQLIMFLFAVGYYVGCAPVNFEKDSSCGANCVSINGKKEYRYAVTPNSGKVDILFVDDNSGSMSYEQNAIANRFSTFIATLDAKSVDYRIGIITTDVSSASNPARSINRNGALQDGRLIEFSTSFPSFSGTGVFYITPSTPNKTALFANTIRRQETLSCEAFLAANPSAGQTSSAYQAACPSPDESGIYAANMTVQNNPNSFIRSDAHLAIVFVGDEDERSSLYHQTASYALAIADLPQALINKVEATYPGKSLKMHSIIIRPGALSVSLGEASSRFALINAGGGVNASYAPSTFFNGGDSGCLNIQMNQMNVRGSYGYLYALATRLTGGVEGDICASDYGSQLSSIGDNIGESFSQRTLYCANPGQIDLQTPLVTFTPANNANAYSISGNIIYFNPNLLPGTQAYLQYSCPE
ncbi:MAG: vWA domain-containing protein [Bdellovibrio sp.]|jgi:hypothetical protein